MQETTEDDRTNTVKLNILFRPPLHLLSIPCAVLQPLELLAKARRYLHVQKGFLERPQYQQIFQPPHSRKHHIRPSAGGAFRQVHDCLLHGLSLAFVVSECEGWGQWELNTLKDMLDVVPVPPPDGVAAGSFDG